MNRVLTPTTVEKRKEEICDEQLLNRQLLFTKDKENLYIKYEDRLIPIGGRFKQNFLEAGDNIEIIRDEDNLENNTPEIVRLLDDIDINTCTLSPDGDNIYNWKGMYKIGEVVDNNALFILMKRTELKEIEKGIIGGEILIKMIDVNDKIHYAHYALTCTSTGSWSLAGAGATPTNVRMCRCKHVETGDYYYGLKLPIGDFENSRIEDTPITEEKEVKTRTYLQIGTSTSENKLMIGAAQSSNLALVPVAEPTPLADDESILEADYEVPVSSLIQNLGWSELVSNENIEENQWKRWFDDNAKFRFHILTREVLSSPWNVLNQSGVIVLRKTGYYYNSKGTRYSDQAAFLLRSTDRQDLTLNHQGYTVGVDDAETGLSTYNHWYWCTMSQLQTFLGFTLCGEWAQYTNDNYRFYLRIYNNNNGDEAVRITRIQVRYMGGAQNICYDNYGQSIGNMGHEVIDLVASDLDPPFNFTTELVNLKTGVYVYMTAGTEVAIGTFLDRTPTAQMQGLELKVTEVSIENVDYDPLISFNNDYVIDNYNEVSSFVANRLPVFGQWDTDNPVLYYTDNADVDGNRTYSFFGDFVDDYNEVVGHEIKEIKFLDNLSLKKAEFWFNGWNEISDALKLESYSDPDFEYQVLSNKSDDNDSFAETFYTDMAGMISKIPTLQYTGIDNAPYKFIVSGSITKADLLAIAELVRDPERQVWLDLSGAYVASDAEDWNDYIFKGCVSLRGLQIPQGVKRISNCVFLWCTYLRSLDLTASNGTFNFIGSETGWSQAVGVFTSTRIRNLILPASVEYLGQYLIGSSNIRNMIFLHQDQDPVKVTQWSLLMIKAGGSDTDFTLPDNFHWYVTKSWFNGYLKSCGWNSGNGWSTWGNRYDWTAEAWLNSETHIAGNAYWGDDSSTAPGSATSNTIYKTGQDAWCNTSGWWHPGFVDKIVVFDPDWNNDEWQEFADKYLWDEDLINEVRMKLGREGNIEIKDPLR